MKNLIVSSFTLKLVVSQKARECLSRYNEIHKNVVEFLGKKSVIGKDTICCGKTSVIRPIFTSK